MYTVVLHRICDSGIGRPETIIKNADCPPVVYDHQQKNQRSVVFMNDITKKIVVKAAVTAITTVIFGPGGLPLGPTISEALEKIVEVITD
jgi:hypothetical protein